MVRKHYRGVARSLILGNASLREGLGEMMAAQPAAKGGGENQYGPFEVRDISAWQAEEMKSPERGWAPCAA